MGASASHREKTGPDDARDVNESASATEHIILTRDAVRAVDKAAVSEYGIPGIVLMENAALGLAHAAIDMLGGISDTIDRRVLIVCGGGNNGGDGYALARHLHNAGADVTLAALATPRGGSDAATNEAICRTMDLPIIEATPVVMTDAAPFDLIVDALFGTGLDRALEGDALAAVRWINAQARPTLAVDLPSGIDCDTGDVLGGDDDAAVRADVTVTFVARKPACELIDAQPWVGRVIVASIGAPIELLERFGSQQQRTPDLDESRAPDLPLRRRRRG